MRGQRKQSFQWHMSAVKGISRNWKASQQKTGSDCIDIALCRSRLMAGSAAVLSSSAGMDGMDGTGNE